MWARRGGAPRPPRPPSHKPPLRPLQFRPRKTAQLALAGLLNVLCLVVTAQQYQEWLKVCHRSGPAHTGSPAQQCWPLFSSGRVTVEGLYPPQSGLKPLPPTPRQSDCLDCGAACKQCSRPLPAGHMWSCHSPNVRTEIQLIRHRPHWAPVCSCAEPDSLVRPGLVQSVNVCFLNKIGTVAVAPVAGQHLCQHCLSHSHRRYALPLRPLRCNKSVLRNSAIDHSYPKHIIIYSFVTCCKQIN